jgi:integrase
MSLRTNIVRRGSVYRFRVRVPADLRERIGRTEISRSLRTKSAICAKSDAFSLYRKAELLWQRIRDPSMTPEGINRLVDDWVTAELTKDAIARTYLDFAEDRTPPGASVTEVAASMFASEAAANVEHWSEVVKRHDWEAARPCADALIAEKGLSIERGSDAHRLLCLALALASVEVEHARLDRSEGRWGARPQFGSEIRVPTPAEILPSTPPAIPTETLSVLVPKFMDEQRRHSGLAPKRLMDFEAALRLFSRWLGEDRSIDRITKKELGEFRLFLPKLPPNFTKRFPKLGLQEIATLAQEQSLRTLQPQTINGKYLVILERFFKWCAGCGFITENPATGIRVTQSKGASEKCRGPFKPDHLSKLFRAPLYAGCKSKAQIYKPGTDAVRDHRYWLPLLGLFTGARLNEICQLHLEDVRTVDGISCISINDEGDRRVKTEAARRLVPIHPDLDRLGFIDHVQRLRDRGQTRLFPEIKAGAGGYLSENVSKWFGRFLRFTFGKKAAKAAGLTFHSFRHTMKDALRAAGVDERIQDWLLGHENDHVSSHYGKGYEPPRLFVEISKVNYPGLDLSALHVG